MDNRQYLNAASLYSEWSPSNNISPLQPNNFVFVREVSFSRAEHHMHSQYMLQSICILARGLSLFRKCPLRDGPPYVQINLKDVNSWKSFCYLTNNLGVEALGEGIWFQWEYAKRRVAGKRLVAGNKRGQQTAVLRNIYGGIIVDLTVRHHNVLVTWDMAKRQQKSVNTTTSTAA